MSATFLFSCGNSDLTESKIIELLEPNYLGVDGEPKPLILQIPLGEKRVKKAIGRNKYKTHTLQTITLGTGTLNVEENKKLHIFSVLNDCPGCIECLELFKEKGLVEYTYVDEYRGGAIVDIKLTEEGRKYDLLEVKDELAVVILGYIKPFEASKIISNIETRTGEAMFSLKLFDLTPFGKAMGAKNGDALLIDIDEPNKPELTRVRFKYYDDEGWALK